MPAPFVLAEGSLSLEQQLAMILLAGELPPSYVGFTEIGANSGNTGANTPHMEKDRTGARESVLQSLTDNVRNRARSIRTILSTVTSISARDLTELLHLLIPRPLPELMTQSVRPVVWFDDDYPGFGGTCFLVRAFGCTFAVTARHVLGGTPPVNLMIPHTCDSGPMDLRRPRDIYWYNAGDYDHVADIAIAVMEDFGDSPLHTVKIGFTNPRPGETVFVPGFPLRRSEVRYDIDDPERPVHLPDGSLLKHLFIWNGIYARGRSLASSAPGTLGSLQFDETDGCSDLNGLSGAPVFVVRGGKLAVGGMVVRAGAQIAHFVPGEAIGLHVMRVAAKEPYVMTTAFKILHLFSVLEGTHPGTAVSRVLADLGGFVSGVGDRAIVQKTLHEWVAGRGPLSKLALRNFSLEKVRRDCGDRVVEMMRSVISEVDRSPIPDDEQPVI